MVLIKCPDGFIEHAANVKFAKWIILTARTKITREE